MLSAAHSLLPFIATHQPVVLFQAMLHTATTAIALHYLGTPGHLTPANIEAYCCVSTGQGCFTMSRRLLCQQANKHVCIVVEARRTEPAKCAQLSPWCRLFKCMLTFKGRPCEPHAAE